jgi:hypothetical protein
METGVRTFLRQVEGYNCGPIACAKILEILGLVPEIQIHNVYGLGTIRNLVTEQWKYSSYGATMISSFVCNNDNPSLYFEKRVPQRGGKIMS